MKIAIALLLICAVASACTGSTLISSERASSLVLQPGDVPPGLARFDFGPENPQGRPFAGNREAGLRAASVARYRQVDPSDTEGPVVVESRAEVFAGKDEASAQLERKISAAAPRGRPVSVPKIGDQTVARTFTQRATPVDARFFVIVWQHVNAVGLITVQGFDGNVQLRDAVSLALAQQRRMARASA
ncbi:MAG: hypothetical protein M3N24_04060 [Actinomycetota bacterium]|nr:hypothetical protein [Actinomycetota bacterium]